MSSNVRHYTSIWRHFCLAGGGFYKPMSWHFRVSSQLSYPFRRAHKYKSSWNRTRQFPTTWTPRPVTLRHTKLAIKGMFGFPDFSRISNGGFILPLVIGRGRRKTPETSKRVSGITRVNLTLIPTSTLSKLPFITPLADPCMIYGLTLTFNLTFIKG